MRKLTVISSALVFFLALGHVSSVPAGTSQAAAANITTHSVTANVDEDTGYWYFVVSYSDTDKRVTNTFYAEGNNLKVYYKVRVALNGFQGDMEGFSFASREEAEQSLAALNNSQRIMLPDPLN
jgi:hypothetical protein